MHIKHIQWRLYCLIFYFGTSKGNQPGERSSDTWHVYSNPNNPTIFPVIYLDKYILSNPDILAMNSLLFSGNCHYNIFLKYSTNSSRTILIVFRLSELKKSSWIPFYSKRSYYHSFYFLHRLSTHVFNFPEGWLEHGTNKRLIYPLRESG